MPATLQQQPGYEPPRHDDTWRWALTGLVLASGAPLGLWVLLTIADPAPNDRMVWIYAYAAISTAIAFTAFGLFAGRLMGQLRNAGLHDALTGLLNRRFLMETLPRLLFDAQRQQQPLALLMIDLDHFKRVNDEYGHQVGDQTLRAVAATIQKQLRAADVLARFGGEEFVAVCPRVSADESIEIAERLREHVGALRAHQLGFGGPQTISIGVATIAGGQLVALEELIRVADEALYRAKQRGRDRVEIDRVASPITR